MLHFKRLQNKKYWKIVFWWHSPWGSHPYCPDLTHQFARSSERADRLCDSSCFNHSLFYQQDKFAPCWHHSLYLEPNTQGSCISALAVPFWNPHAIVSQLLWCCGGLCRQQLPVKPLKILLWFFTGSWKSCCRKSPFLLAAFIFPWACPCSMLH